MRADDIANRPALGHQLFIDVQPARRIEHHHVVSAAPRLRHRPPRNGERVFRLDHRQGIDADLLPQDLELFLGGRPARVERSHENAFFVALLEPFGDFRGGRGFPRALQPHHEKRHRRRRLEIDPARIAPQRLDERVVHDFDDHLPGRDRFDDLLPDRPGLDRVDEAAHHVERHVRLDQRPSHFPHRGFDIAVRQAAAPGELVENPCQPFL
jgi:hypothetical protein